MSDDAKPLSVRDVLRLTTKLAERMLQMRSTGSTLSVNELEAVKAAEFLLAHHVPWPKAVSEVIDSLVAQREAIEAAPGDVESRVRLPNLN